MQDKQEDGEVREELKDILAKLEGFSDYDMHKYITKVIFRIVFHAQFWIIIVLFGELFVGDIIGDDFVSLQSTRFVKISCQANAVHRN